MAKGRQEFFDIPKKLYINEGLSEWADLYCEEKNISFASYVRQLITDHKDSVENELCKTNSVNDRDILSPTLPHPNGLYTVEQVAQLINAMRVK